MIPSVPRYAGRDTVCRLYDHEYDPIRLIRQLQRTSPVAIYRSGQAMTGPNYQKYMLQILKAYNGSSRTKSLPIKQ